MALSTHSMMEELSARMEEIAGKVEALTARMDALSPSLPRTDSQRSPPSQVKTEAPTLPRPFSFGSASKGFDFSSPSASNEEGTSAAPKGFSFFPTNARGSAQSQANVSSPPPMFPSASSGTDFARPNQSQTSGNSAVPPRPPFFFPLRDSPQAPKTAQTPSPSAFAPIGTESETRGTSPAPKAYVSSSPSEAPSQSQESRSSVHSQMIKDVPSFPRPSSLGSSGKDSGSSQSAQHSKDIAAAIAADFTQLSVKHSQAIPNSTNNSMENVPPVTTGSSNPPYAPYFEKDPAEASIIINYQSISCMPAYRGTSFEELRLLDYAQGRKTADSSSSQSAQRSKDIAAAIAADFSQLSVKYSQAIPNSSQYPSDRPNNLMGNVPPITTGSSNSPPAPHFEKDPAEASITNNYQSISRMPAIPTYRGTRFEELRFQDYAQGRKTAGAFGQSVVFGGVQHPHIEPRISYNCNNEAWIRHRLIDSKEPILFVGESMNRSLPVALAIMRESWDGIWASSLYKEEAQKLLTLLASAQDRSQVNVGFFGRLKKSSPWKSVPEMRHKLSELTNALDPKSHDEVVARLSLVVDATRLKTSIQGPTRNIWFQCPWISRRDNTNTTAKLLEGFISSAAAIQKSGEAVFLGLTAHTDYRDRYGLDNFKKVARKLGYEIFMDECFILHAIDAGYKHESVANTDIHRLLLDYHQTFVLVKREHSEHTSVKERISTQRKELEAQQEELELHLRDLRARETELSLVDEAMT
ncbi:hypothetical protein B0H17DRAFT_1261507 [Mycena rosella]|uniref:Uncharacterized protein n=1 Tax=Mycena rosella TaxID=1033263 RepID=A0AAD7CR46_MYCRO|nr:hypothetical protein B0H17DRAFT_1261507 [Mycena rosella]